MYKVSGKTYERKMTREQAIGRVGLKNVEAAETDNCEPTCRIGGNGITHDDPYLEYRGAAVVDYDLCTPEQIYNLPIGGCHLAAYYQVSNELEQEASDKDCSVWDLADIDIVSYEIE